MRNCKKGSSLTVTLVLLLVFVGSVFWAYRIFWVDFYDGHFEELIEDSDIKISVTDCRKVGSTSRLKCDFVSDEENIKEMIDYFALEHYTADDTGYPKLFTNGSGETVEIDYLSSCDYDTLVKEGAELYVGVWSPSIQIAGQTFYSGASLIRVPYSTKACILLDID